MAGSNLKDPKNNDLASPLKPYDFGSSERSENNPTRPLPGSGGIDDDQCTPEGRRAGYGHMYLGPNNDSLENAPKSGPANAAGGVANKTTASSGGGRAMGGHNMDERNQYTVKLPRGSSL